MINKDKIIEALDNMNDEERVDVWNAIHGKDSTYHIYRMEEINEIGQGHEPLDILQHFHDSRFDPFDMFWCDLNEDGEGIISFNSTEESELYDVCKILDYIDCFGADRLPGLAEL